jgi:hypothetical protein
MPELPEVTSPDLPLSGTTGPNIPLPWQILIKV